MQHSFSLCAGVILLLSLFMPVHLFGFNGNPASQKTANSPNQHAQIDTTVVEIRSEGVELSYSKTEIQAKAGNILLIRYINDSDMNHNIVLVRGEQDIRPVGVAALQAVGNDWIPENEMDRILAYSELAHAGETVEFSFKVPPPGTYPYICTYSAHWTQMQGRLISTE